MATHVPGDFGSECPPPRIIGTETEYHLQREAPSSDVLHKKLANLGITAVGQYCSNGARIYPEFGIEYASPECAGPTEATAADFAGLNIIQKLTAPSNPSKISKTHFPVLRHTGSFNTKTGKINTRGYHENFLIPYPTSDTDREAFRTVMGSFLATRIIWDGVGLVTNQGYFLSQKAAGIGNPVLDGYGDRTTHGSKPLAGLMAPSGSSEDKLSPGWGLLEVRSADSHMSRSHTFSSLAITSLVLRLIERKAINAHNIDNFILTAPEHALQRVNTTFGRETLRLQSGKITSALSLQTRFAELISDMAAVTDLPSDEKVAAGQFTTLCQKLETYKSSKDIEPLADSVEWAAKLFFLRHKYGEDVLQQKPSEAVAFDLQWHRIDEKSVGLKVYGKHDPLHLEANDISNIPINTRAAVRGKVIKSGQCTDAGWNYVTVNYETPIKLNDYWNADMPESLSKELAEVA